VPFVEETECRRMSNEDNFPPLPSTTSVLPAHGRLFQATLGGKNSAAEEKIGPLAIFSFVKAFFALRNKIVFVCISRKIIIFPGLAWN